MNVNLFLVFVWITTGMNNDKLCSFIILGATLREINVQWILKREVTRFH